MGQYYDRPYRVPVWVVLNIGPRKTKAVGTAMVQDGAYALAWPANTYKETLSEMKKNGWHHILDQKKPYRLDPQFLAVSIAKHLQAVFGPNALLTGSHERPYHQALDRTIKEDADFAKLFDEALSLERDISLSQIFNLAEPKSKVYISGGPVNSSLVQRLCENLITVGEDPSHTLNVEGKTSEDIKTLIDSAIEQRLKF